MSEDCITEQDIRAAFDKLREADREPPSLPIANFLLFHYDSLPTDMQAYADEIIDRIPGLRGTALGEAEKMTLAEVGRAVLHEFGNLPGVKAVEVSYTTLPVTVTVEEGATEDLRRVVYTLEWNFMRRFPWVLFDWHLRVKEDNENNSSEVQP